MLKNFVLKIVFFICTIFLFTGCSEKKKLDIKNYRDSEVGDVLVTGAWVNKGEAHKAKISIHNATFNVVEYLEVGILLYDEKGNPVSTGKSFKGIQATNMIEVEKNKLALQPDSFYDDVMSWTVDSKAAFCKVHIKTIAYTDQSKWANVNFKDEVNKDWNRFDTSEGKNETSVITGAQSAVKTAPVEIVSAISEKTNTKSMCIIVFKNKDIERIINKIEFLILMFDENGKPVKVEQVNSRLLSESSQILIKEPLELKPNEEIGKEYYWEIESNARYIKVIPLKINYSDGSSWRNKYACEWITVEKDTYRITSTP